ncbi:MAG: hypothetical protein IIB44_03750 [Candidatus Marinimicrobia bacterium]|nr:hypothetical protein [Candidatus Neomarinimicrobiota bacterium]MCH8069358.1 hypothetical protein [Candidatus Neomarinimicrobiota bacterium]
MEKENLRAKTEVKQRKRRRRLTKGYKLKVLQEYDSAIHSGEKGAILRREGLYSSAITEWRKRLLISNIESVQKHALEVENLRLRKELDLAKLVIDVQKKILDISALSTDVK